MKLWIDGQALQSPSRYRGIGRYVIELLRAISQADDAPDMHISFNLAMENTVDAARFMVREFIPQENIHTWHSIPDRGAAVDGYSDQRRFSEALLAYHVAALGTDVALSPSPFEGGNNQCVPLLDKHGQDIRIAGIFFDAIPLRFPEVYLAAEGTFDYFVRHLHAHQNFDVVLSISDFSDKEIRDLVNVKGSHAIYAGLSSNFLQTMKAIEEGKGHDQNISTTQYGQYVLYVGGLDWRKNVELIFKAFPLLPERHDHINFVIAGQHQPNELQRFEQLWDDNGLSMDRLHMPGQVTDEELITLYTNALCLVQPSLLEGFGLTVLEAAACDTPVVVSDAGSLPEVVGTRDGLFDPRDKQALTDRLIEVFDKPELTRTLVNRAKERIKTYTWRNSATLTLEAIAGIIAPERAQPATDPKQVLQGIYKTTEIDFDVATAAAAFATPKARKVTEFLWDVSATAQVFSGFDTGIQRVVRRVAGHVNDLDGHALFAAMEPAAYIDVDLKNGKFQTQPQTTLQVDQHHTVVILDSSWDLSHVHAKQLKRARLLGGRVYSVLYDLVPIRVPGMCLTGLPTVFSAWIEMLASHADGIICISRAIAEELILLLKGIDFNREIEIHYWHLGNDFVTKTYRPEEKKNDSADRPIQFLMVGTIEPRKGYAIALDAFEKEREQGLNAELTIVGRKGWSSMDVTRRLEMKRRLNSGITWLDNASDEELAAAYNKADAIICASHAEGFGLPIVEAAHAGIPVIASDIPVFREVGEMASTTYFTPGDANDLGRALREFKGHGTSTQPLNNSLSWDESAAWLVDIVQGQRKPFAVHSPSHVDFDRSYSRHALRTDRDIDIKADEFTLEVIGTPALSDSGAHIAYIRLLKTSPGIWTSLGPDGSHHGGIAIGARYEQNGVMIEQPDSSRAMIPYAVVPDLEYIFALPLNSELWRNGKRFHIELLIEGVRWIGHPTIISRYRDH